MLAHSSCPSIFIKLLLIQLDLRINTSIMSELSSTQEITCKKIQNYIFNFSDLLGQGNFSKVYKAHNEVTKQVVAIKIIELNSLKSKKLEQLLFSQIEILKKLNHPNVLRCHQVFTSNRNCYIITELCNEGDLQSKLRNKKYLKEQEAEKYIKDVFRGLYYLAENYIVHRDVKVANIFIHNGEAKLADFGFAKYTKSKFKDINIGSPIYMSPQGLIENIYGPKTDIWAFGMLIYELLHGETPFSHCKSENELKYNMSIPIGWSQLKAELSNQIKEVILKCLEIDENKRISAVDLKRLPYFYRGQNLSPNKFITKNASLSGSYDTRLKSSPFHNDSLSKLPFKSQNNFYDKGKYRIKTENEIQQQQKRTFRQYSEAVSSKPEQMPRESVQSGLRQQKSAYSFLKLPLQEQKNRRQSSGRKYNIAPPSPNSFSNMGMNQRQNSSLKPADMILSTRITFKQCVNILHYCRLIFKHLVLMKEINFGDENQTSIFKKWLSAILKTLMREINEKKVKYDGQNSEVREKKLEEVTSQYIKKYSKDLSIDLSKVKLEESLIINYEKIYNYFTSVFQMVDQMIQKEPYSKLLCQLGHSIIMICEHTRIMKACYEEKSYKNIEKLKEIQEFLATNKTQLIPPSYQWYKKKYGMITVDSN